MNTHRHRRSADAFGLLALLVHRTSQDAASILRRHGLNPAQLQLLLAVRDQPGSRQRELGQRFGVSGGNVSLLVTKLTAVGLLRREASGASNQIWLTEAGEELVDRLRPEQDDFMVQRFQSLSDAELDELYRLAEKALEGLPPIP